MFLRFAVLLALAPLASLAGSVSNCGGANDHISNVTVSLSPDPIVRGQPFTFSFAGDLDEDLDVVMADIDLDVSILSLISKKISKKGRVDVTPAVPKGPVKLIVGPFNFGSVIGAGSIQLSGKVQLKNAKAEPVVCVQLDMNIPTLESSAVNAAPAAMETSRLQSVESCGNANDHVKDFHLSQDSQGVVTATGMLDEAVVDSSLAVSMTVKEWFVKVPLSFNTKIHYAPGFQKGDFKLVLAGFFGLSSDMLGLEAYGLSSDMFGLEAYGSFKLDDDKQEEIACVKFDETLLEKKILRANKGFTV